MNCIYVLTISNGMVSYTDRAMAEAHMARVRASASENWNLGVWPLSCKVHEVMVIDQQIANHPCISLITEVLDCGIIYDIEEVEEGGGSINRGDNWREVMTIGDVGESEAGIRGWKSPVGWHRSLADLEEACEKMLTELFTE